MQPPQASSPEPSLAHGHEPGLVPVGGARATARLYPSALSDGGWYVLTTDTPAGGAVYSPPPGHLLVILEELLTGDTDVTMSRRLNMSPRTFSRRVAELLDYLGVNTRFQAGMQVALHGWVPLGAYAPPVTQPHRRNQSAYR
ncbi:MAG TPA: hypothetical protein VGI74_03940 [Streptosporangiaceae bacterium]